MNRHVGWASRAYISASRLDNNYINKINSYLHKYLSESDDLWINSTPLDERDPIKISAVINKLIHMEFGPSCQFNNRCPQETRSEPVAERVGALGVGASKRKVGVLRR